MSETMIRTAMLVVNDEGATGSPVESCIDCMNIIRKLLSKGPFIEVDYQIVPREQAMIRAKMRMWTEISPVDLVLSTGGTGLALRDRTYDATLEIVERPLHGLVQLMFLGMLQNNTEAALWRLQAGFRRKSLVINLPDNAQDIQNALGAIVKVLPKAVLTETS